ncbi:MAG: transglutaminase-like domain-containing protein, partial [Desulfatiglandales bacterium]
MSSKFTPYLSPTEMIQSDHPEIKAYLEGLVKGRKDHREIAKLLYLDVRDKIVYDPYSPFWSSDHYKATYTMKRGRGFCIQKAALLCTLSRA